MGLDVWKSCFADIAAQAGILAFLQFGKTATESKKDPIKLLKLLKIFASLNRLRLDFIQLFGGAACAEIQNWTRDLIKRHTPPPQDGSIPRVVTFITDYCNELLGDDYKPILTQVLVIERSWKHEKFQEGILMNELLNLVKAIELNVETWSRAYEDAHLYKHLKGTEIGTLLGDSWLRKHEQYKEYYSSLYLRESWGKLPALLRREGLILFSGGRATARDLGKKRLKSFNEAFDDMHRKQSNWVILDKDLWE
ncbi:exocyst subunit exo70 family protein G1 [Forsythia ovata]|uniref:Exocyst subunit Exo70 family protein n=1 Tax=Forsythia ovata TaxID=205694 RepID=A0ABD1PKL2_9LAMI